MKREEKASELFLLLFLATMGGMWDLSSLSGNRTPAPCSESWVSYPLDHQGSPKTELFKRDLEECGCRKASSVGMVWTWKELLLFWVPEDGKLRDTLVSSSDQGSRDSHDEQAASLGTACVDRWAGPG